VTITAAAGTGTLPGGFTVEEKDDGGDGDSDGGNGQDSKGNGNGEIGGCACASVSGDVSASELLIGWAVVGLCWGSGYFVVRRRSRRKK